MINYLADLFRRLIGKEKIAIPSNLLQKDFKRFVKNSASAAKEANKRFQPNQWG